MYIKKKDNTYLKKIVDQLKEVSNKGTCLRLKVGALIVDESTGEILSEGYNTSATGTPTCEDEGRCLTNEEGRCFRTIHAEVNAIIKTEPSKLKNSILFVTHSPCENCSKVIKESGIKEVYYLYDYKNSNKEKLSLGLNETQLKSL